MINPNQSSKIIELWDPSMLTFFKLASTCVVIVILWFYLVNQLTKTNKQGKNQKLLTCILDTGPLAEG